MAVAAETRDSLFNNPGSSNVPGRTNRMNTNLNRNRTGIREQMSRMNSGTDSFLKTFQSSNKQLVTTIQQGDKRVSELLSKTYAANNNTANNLNQLVNLEARSYKRGRDYEVKVDKDKLGFMRTTANQIKSLFSITKEQKERDELIREEDVEFLEKEERANIERNEKLKKIEEALTGKASGGFINKIMGAFSTAAGFVLGAAATSIGSLFKGIVSASVIRRATGAISAVSSFFGSIATRVGAVFGITAAGSGNLRKVLRTVPIVGSVITGIMGIFSGIEAWQNVDEILDLKGKEATLANKVAATAGTFANTVTFGFSDWLSTQFSFENTSEMINTGFDKIGDIFGRIRDAVTAEFDRFQSAESFGAYAADVGNRAWSTITNVFSRVKNYVIGGLTSFVTSIDNFF